MHGPCILDAHLASPREHAMFEVSDDEILFDEILQSGLQAELLRVCAARSPGRADSAHRLERTADDMWEAYITPPAGHALPVRHPAVMH